MHRPSRGLVVARAVLFAVPLAVAWIANPSFASLASGLPVVVLGLAPPPHPTRNRILEHLRMLPGDHLRSIARVLRLSVGEARYHLHVLRRSGLIREEKVRHRVRFYPSDSKSEADRNVLFKKHWAHRDLRARVLHAVQAQGTARPAQVAKTVGISRQLATYHLSHLTASGQVARDGAEYRPSNVPSDSYRGDQASDSFPGFSR